MNDTEHKHQIFALCVAYESGFGHGAKEDGLQNPYEKNSDAHHAWNFGHEKGYERRNQPDDLARVLDLSTEVAMAKEETMLERKKAKVLEAMIETMRNECTFLLGLMKTVHQTDGLPSDSEVTIRNALQVRGIDVTRRKP
jgi:hypothetical protein